MIDKNLHPLPTLIEIIYTIQECAADIEITKGWIGDREYGTQEQTKKHLNNIAATLKQASTQLKVITGLRPRK